MNLFTYLNKIALSDLQFTFIIAEIFFASILAFTAVLTYSKSRKFSTLLLILTAFLLFVRMSLRILGLLNILYIEQIKVMGVPLYSHLSEILPYFTFTIAFIIIALNDKKS